MRPCTAILDWIDTESLAMLQMLEEWAAINTGSENIPGLSLFSNAIKSPFAKLGGAIMEVALPPRTIIAPDGKLTAIQHGKALSILKRPDAHLRVLFSGHMDTVYSSGHPFQKIERVNANTLRGPGVADMKGGLIVMLKAIEAFEQHPFAKRIGWEILINPDEEVGSIGSESLLRASARKSSIGLVFEPSFPDGSMVSSRKGSANITIVVRGRSAHAGRDFDQGRNAIIALARVIEAIHGLNKNERGITINIGHITGGGPVNVVPDLAICRLNIRSVQPEDFAYVHDQIRGIVDGTREEGIELSLRVDHSRPPKAFDEKNRQLFDLLKHCANEEGYDLSSRPSGGACDSNLLTDEGLPVLDALGVIGGNIHTPQEYALIDSLASRARLVCLLLIKIASGDSPSTEAKNPSCGRTAKHDNP